MRRSWLKCLALGLGLAVCQARAGAQDAPTVSGLLPSSPVLSEQGKPPSAQEYYEQGRPKDSKGKHDDPHAKHDDHGGHDDHKHHEPPDLGLRDFLTTGWDEKFEERHRKGVAPRFNLFKTRQGFLEQIFAVDYGYLSRTDGGRFNEHEAAAGFEYALNRRFEIDAKPFYTWKTSRGERASQNGLRWDLGTRFQLIDTTDTAVNVQLRVVTPSAHLEDRQTTLGFVFAGFNDLTKHGLCRTGLYYHVEYDALLGPRDAEPEAEGLPPVQRASSRITYSVALAKTLVDPEVPLIGDFTVFLEAFGATDLNGTKSSQTFFSFTPGVRMNLSGREEKAWWLQTGYEIPVTGPRAFNYGFRIALIRDF